MLLILSFTGQTLFCTEHPPTSPTNPELFFKYETDTRPGYWKHAIVTISWNKPQKGMPTAQDQNLTYMFAIYAAT